MSKLGDKKKAAKGHTVNIGDPDKKYPWAFIATPAYDGKVETDFAQSLAEASFCAPLHGVKVTQCVMGNGIFIDLARNIFARMFLDEFKDCTHLFFIDADLGFPPNAFIGLMKSGLPISAGVYRRRQEPADYPLSLSEWPEGGGLWVEDGYVMADRVPTGFLCIERSVVEEMAAEAPQLNIAGQPGPVPQLFYTKVDEENRFIGEDFNFCDDYRKKYGKPIHVWPDIDFVHGGYPGNLLEYMDNKIKELESGTSSAA